MATAFGRYLIEEKLGQGGMGAVYLATDQSLNRQVALKVITSGDPEALARFQSEAQAVAQLKHPNIVQVYDVGVIGQRHYFTMEYIEGTSLDKIIGSEQKPGIAYIVNIIRQVASALHYAHSRNIIHRDIKPANILIDKDHNVRLTDFGVAKQLTGLNKSLTITGTTVGTPEYMSPEQAMGKKDELDQRSDIFSLGVTLYQCLTGRLPFAGTEIYDVFTKVINQEPALPSAIIRGIPRDIETICLKCLEKDKAKRFQSAQELETDLKLYLDGQPISARRTPHITRLWLKAKKNRTISLSIAGAALILLAAVIVFTIFSAKAARQAEVKAVLDRLSAAKTPDEKIQIAEAALKIDPTYGDAYQVIGYAYKDKAKAIQDKASSDVTAEELWDRAYEYFSKAIEATPTLAYSYYERGVITAYNRNKKQEALADFALVAKYDPESHIGYAAKGYIDYVHKEYAGAVRNYTRAIELNPAYAMAYAHRGAVHAESGNLEQALMDLNKAIDLDPKESQAHNNRGAAYYKKAELEYYSDENAHREYLEKAIADYNEALKLKPKYTSPLSNRGRAYEELGEPDKALADYDETIRLDPKFARAYLYRANIYAQKMEIDKAIADYNEAIRLSPDEAGAYYDRGIFYGATGEPDKALSDYTEAIRLNPKHAEAYTNRGGIYNQRGEVAKALADYNEAIRINPKLPQPYLNRGGIYAFRGDFKAAAADGEMFLQLAPNFPGIENLRAIIEEWRKKQAEPQK